MLPLSTHHVSAIKTPPFLLPHLHPCLFSSNPEKMEFEQSFPETSDQFAPKTPEQSVPKDPPIATFKYSNRVILKDILSRSDGGAGLAGQKAVVGGWVKVSKEVREQPAPPEAEDGSQPKGEDLSCVEILQARIPLLRSIFKVWGVGREKLDPTIQKPPSISVLRITDGSCAAKLQVLVHSSLAAPAKIMPVGTSVLVEGILQPATVQGENVIELKAERTLHVGTVEPNKYPLSKKKLPMERLREFPHFSPRTTTVASIGRIRHAIIQGTQTFFTDEGFLYVQVPIITTTDCEGFSEKFQVTTLLGNKEIINKALTRTDSSETRTDSAMEKGELGEDPKRRGGNWEELVATLRGENTMNEQTIGISDAIEIPMSAVPAKTKALVDFSGDFFSCQTFLTVSGRLHLESYARALGNVYTFGPRFRAERCVSRKQAAEMWMIEVEMAFSNLEGAMTCAEDFLKCISKRVEENCLEDLKFLAKRVDQSILSRLDSVASSAFLKISYAEVLEVARDLGAKKLKELKWGEALTEENESYLADIFNKPVIVYNHPKELKPFYARLNDDGKTVATFDVIVPKAGKFIRGSQNEERLEVLTERIKELKLPKKQYKWYLDLRRQGTVTNSGFSVAFDLLVAYATGLGDVKDAIPFPRSPGKAKN
ncbi:Asparagine--tRNA ligase [Bertholletia excelsa]